ncbi:hypothetical protein KR067_012563, partial [Drosophila pandora]
HITPACKMKSSRNGGQTLLIAPSPTARLMPLRTYSNASSLGHHHDRTPGTPGSPLHEGDLEESGLGYTHTLV